MAWWGWLLVFAALAILLILCVTLFIFTGFCGRKAGTDPFSIARYYPADRCASYIQKMKEEREWLKKRKHRVVSMKTFDGLELFGTIYETSGQSDRYVIFFHGYRGGGFNDFSLFARYYLTHGYNALAVEQRAQNLSEGKYITFGARECRDCKAWADWLVQTEGPQVDIVLHGGSMGAETVLSSLAFQLPPQVKGVIADCAYTSIAEEMRFAFKRFKVPYVPFAWFGCLWTKLLAGFSPADNPAIEAVKDSKIPVLLVHGDKDRFVPTEMSYALKDACPTCDELIIVKDASHFGSILVDRDDYESAMTAFLSRIFR